MDPGWPPEALKAQAVVARTFAYTRWSVLFSYDEVLAALQKKRMIGGKLRGFSIGRRTALGIVVDFLAKIGAEKLTVKANDLRLALGAAKLKSARILRIRDKNG